jgi:Domain of unknown function (DUF4383)
MSARHVRYFALVYGIVFLLVGIAGFVPGLVTPPQAGPDLTVATGFGRLFDLFPVNVLHNLVHLAFGVWGLAAYRTFSAARLYAQSVAVIYAILTVMGTDPAVQHHLRTDPAVRPRRLAARRPRDRRGVLRLGDGTRRGRPGRHHPDHRPGRSPAVAGRRASASGPARGSAGISCRRVGGGRASRCLPRDAAFARDPPEPRAPAAMAIRETGRTRRSLR